MRTEKIAQSKFSSSLNYEITHDVPLKFEVYSFISIVANRFNLQPILVDRIKFIFNELWNKHTTFFNAISYENTVLGVMLFVDREFYDDSVPPINVTQYAEMLYGKSNIERNLIQIYTVEQTVSEIFS